MVGADLDENVVAENVRQESRTLSGPGESSCSKSVDKPWSGKPHVQVTIDVSQKGKEKVLSPLYCQTFLQVTLLLMVVIRVA